jgi:hypothetical protein
LLIYDKSRVAPIFESNEHGVYPVDSVLAVLEVKRGMSRAMLI